MSSRGKKDTTLVDASRGAAVSEKQVSNSNELQRQKRRTNSLHLPLETHWELSQVEKKKFSLSRMSFKSIQESLMGISRSKRYRSMFQGVHDPKEEHVVQSFRQSLLSTSQLPEKYDDYHTLLRFLRMRGFDISKAKDAFLNMLKWREDFAVDTIAKDFKFDEYEAVKKCYPHGYHGVDRYGRPLYIERIGSVDLNTLLRVTTVDRYIKNHISEQEKTLNLRYAACSLAARKYIASTTSILDVKGVGTSNFSKPARELFTEIQKIDSTYYPETLHRLYIVNAGSGFRVLWKAISAFLDARTRLKIQVLGNQYQSKLLEAVDPSNLPDFLGGSCTCSEYGGCLLKDKGPWTDPEINNILQEYFSRGEKFADYEESDSKIGVDGFQQEVQTGDVAEQVAQKILELEDCLVDTKELIETLLSKQQKLTDHIEQLKKLTSV
ncbi:phosphatidylinositol/phosphatidylcholine transfer protein SFH11 [Elaeis guineensis]|uniref:Phosphatidylinositol/phosphatidylcholine transfer protein SFH11 n=1 Tax=Elaeis guineensis var. tenera TaxID=51953 RepID=A0A6I9RYV5_ELAGV|nr:phosphatidylinositol/phosphatidylcholine transfer protein SFH11 [Elaeis guineensis]